MTTTITGKHVRVWQRNLRKHPSAEQFLREQRGLTDETIRTARIGYDEVARRLTIPVFNGREVVNVRRYKPNAKGSTPKITSVKGSKVGWYSPPGSDPDAADIIIAEGELDALLTAQELSAAGLDDVAVLSGTGGAGKVPTDLSRFEGRAVYVAYDCDDAGRTGANRVAARLAEVAAAVHVVDLGLPGAGDDLTDFFVTHDRSAEALWMLCQDTPEWQSGSRRDYDELLTIAVEEQCVESGSRNQALFWLACQLRDERYDKSEAVEVGRSFRERVEGTKPDPFPDSEVIATVQSAYSEPPRDALGQVDAGYAWNDAGNAQRLVHLHGDDMRWVPALRSWRCWDGRRWARDSDGQAERWAMDTVAALRREANKLFDRDADRGAKMLAFATRSGSAGRIAAMLELAKKQRGMTMAAAAFDADPRMLVCRNGVVVLGDDGVTFRPHHRDDYGTRLVNVDYDPDAEAEEWAEFIEVKAPDPEVRRYLHKLAGYSIIGGNPRQKIVLLIGRTHTGKSTFGKVLMDVLGRDYAGTFNLTVLRARQDESPSAELVDVIFKRFLFVSEASKAWELHADQIKRVTGGDRMKARPLYVNEFVERVPDFTAWMATNNAPTINGADKALWRRLVAVPFDIAHDVDSADPDLERRIVGDEAAGVLAWLVEGWRLYITDGLDDMPAAVVETTMRLRESLNPFDAWLGECCEQGADYRVPSADLWESYREWAADAEIADRLRLDKTTFWAALDGREFESKLLRYKRGSDSKRAYRLGLRLRAGRSEAVRGRVT